MSSAKQAAYDACLSTLRQTDLDRYLACLLLPEDKRGPIAALYAFNAEIARIRDIVHQPLPGEVRMQWWRDLIEDTMHGEASANPLAAGLLFAIENHGLPRQTLVNLIEARIFDLYDDPMDSIRSFEGYAGETASTLIQLASLILAPEIAHKTAETAGHGGVAQAVAGSLQLLSAHSTRGQMYIPADILAATGLTSAEFLKGHNKPAISAAIRAFTGFGRDHLQKARAAARATLTNQNIGAFLTVSLAEPVLRAADKQGASMIETSLQPPQWRRQWRMWRARQTCRF